MTDPVGNHKRQVFPVFDNKFIHNVMSRIICGANCPVKDYERRCFLAEINIVEETCQTFLRFSKMIHIVRKSVFGVSNQVQHKPGCTATEDGYRLEILDLGGRGMVLSM